MGALADAPHPSQRHRSRSSARPPEPAMQSPIFLKRKQIIDHIRRHQPLSRQALMTRFQLRHSTAAHIVRELEEAGICRRSQEEALRLSAGRPAQLCVVNPDYLHTIGLDFDRQQLTGILINFAGDPICEAKTRRFPPDIDRDQCLHEVLGMAGDLLQQCRDQSLNPVAIGVGAPGRIELDSGVSDAYPHIPGWDRVPLGEELLSATRLPTFAVENSTCFSLAAAWMPELRPTRRLVSLLLRSGFGLGVVEDRRVNHPSTAASPQFGHTIVNPDGPLCLCGRHGCLESYCSGWALRRRLTDSSALLLSRQEIETAPLPQIAESLLASPDDAGRAILHEAGRYLGLAVLNATNLFFPDLVTIHTRLHPASSLLQEAVAETFTANGLPPENSPELLFCPNEESGAVGAALYALERLI